MLGPLNEINLNFLCSRVLSLFILLNIIQPEIPCSFAAENNVIPVPSVLEDEGSQDEILKRMVERSLEPPKVSCSYGIKEIAGGILNADMGLIAHVLEAPNGLLWFEHVLKQVLMVDPPFQFQQFFFSVIVRFGKDSLMTRIFYNALANIDPAKAGIISLNLMEICEHPDWKNAPGLMTKLHYELLNKHLSHIASLWKLDITDRQFLTVFFKAKLMDRGFLKQVNIFPTESGHILLRNEEVGTVFEVAGDTIENIWRIGAMGLEVTHLSFIFPDDMIPYIEALLKIDNFFFPFKKMIEKEIVKRKGAKLVSASGLSFSQLVSLYDFTIDQGRGICNVEEFLRSDSPQYKVGEITVIMNESEAIIVQYQGISILLKPSSLSDGWNPRRSPYQVIGFVDGENLYPLREDDRSKIQQYLEGLSAKELTHYVVFGKTELVDEKSVFAELSVSGRGEVYEGHDLALENEARMTLAQINGAISIVDIGMGGGELVERLRDRFGSDPRVRFYGTEPDSRMRRLAKLRVGDTQIADASGRNLAQAPFIRSDSLSDSYRIAILEGVIACGVTYPEDGEEILLELFKIGFEKIFITANTPVNLNFNRLAGILERFGYRLERTLYPQNLFNTNLPKAMFVLSKIEKDQTGPLGLQARSSAFDLAA